MNGTHTFLFVFLIVLQVGCSNPQEKEAIVIDSLPEQPEKVQQTYTGDNSRSSLDWSGTYFNVLPCASCEGIETWLTLKPNSTFELKTNYLGLNDAREEIFTGTFEWDSSGSTIQLKGLIGDAPGKYKIGENRIWHLDQEGLVIEGALAERYILNKK